MGRYSSVPLVKLAEQSNVVLPKCTIGLEREGVIIEALKEPITSIHQIKFINGSLEAIRLMKQKGYSVVIINDQASIHYKKLTPEQVDVTNDFLMQEFGKAGISTIEGLFYSTTDLKNDIYAKPNVGMFRKAESVNKQVKFKNGFFVGHNVKDAKAAEKIGATPIIVKTGNGEQTLDKLNTFANKELLKKTKIFNNLLEFAESLE